MFPPSLRSFAADAALDADKIALIQKASKANIVAAYAQASAVMTDAGNAYVYQPVHTR